MKTENDTKKVDSYKATITKWLALGFCGLVFAATIWHILGFLPQSISQGNLFQLLSGILIGIFPLTFAILASLILYRQPTHVIGWLMVLVVIGGLLTLGSERYFQGMAAPPIAPSLTFWLMLFTYNLSWMLFIVPLILIPLYFPNDYPPSRRWNWVIYLAAALLIFNSITTLFQTEIGLEGLETEWVLRNPIGFMPVDQLENVVNLIWVVALGVLIVACMTAIIVRYRRGSKLEQAQIKWMIYSSLFFYITYVLLLLFSILFNQNNSFAIYSTLIDFLLGLSFLAIPTGICIAILRYRLWDIDFVINRSIIYGSLTIFLIMLSGSILFIINTLFQNISGGPIIAVALSAAIFGALLQPVRRNLQRFVDKRFYNIQIDYNKTPAINILSTSHGDKPTHIGNYQNLELIGSGGMAEIYKSSHPTLGIPVAIKVLPAKLSHDNDFRKRFEREAQTVQNLQHANIVRMYDYGETNGIFYMVMQYINGKDLNKILQQKTRLSLMDALPIIQQVADALDHAHSQGIIHRDIKPANIMLDQSTNGKPRAILMDFGIAKILNANTAITHTGHMLGTFDYIAPEQIQGVPNLDHKTDIYSLGVMMYQILAGELPFKHQNIGALLIAHLNQPAPDIGEILPEFRDIGHAIQKAMAKNPQERFATATEFVKAVSQTPTL